MLRPTLRFLRVGVAVEEEHGSGGVKSPPSSAPAARDVWLWGSLKRGGTFVFKGSCQIAFCVHLSHIPVLFIEQPSVPWLCASLLGYTQPGFLQFPTLSR